MAASEMEPDMVKVMQQEGATLVFLDVPEGTEFGIDYNSWNVGPRFKGIKMIPPGIHFVYFSAVSNTKDVAPRTGFFYNFTRQEVLVKQWDKRNEGMKTEEINNDPEVLQQNKRDFDRFLGPYPYESYRKWVSLTHHITPGLLSRLQPLSGVISSVAAFESVPSNTAERQELREKNKEQEQNCDNPQLPTMNVIPGTEVNFTKIPEKKYPEDATPSEITKYSMDYTYCLKQLLTNFYEKDGHGSESNSHFGILGEIQFAFVCFLIGQNYEAFEQWKHLVHMLCWCDEGLSLYPELYTSFITLLHHHINEIPPDFFVDIVTSDNFLTRTLQQFFSCIDNLDVNDGKLAALRTRGLKFRDNLQRKFNWDFTEEPDDYAPMVVE